MDTRFIIGIDEAGRGPIAGPVAVGAVLLPQKLNNWEYWHNLKDSKKLSPGKRARWFSYMQGESVDVSFDTLPHFAQLRHAVAMQEAHTIDATSITAAIRTAIAEVIQAVTVQLEHDVAPHDITILLDGGLKAPDTFAHQHTIIKGDENEPAIALASIAAKETRDAHMHEAALLHPQYGFDQHKGYGTKHHISAVKTHGLSPLHRASFCGAFVPVGQTP